MSGIFITFEGPDGSGKTTIAELLYNQLISESYDVILTREPGGNDIAEQIRQIILDTKNTTMDVRTEALLYAASRRQHLVEKIIPALKAGKIILCDRFIDSSLVYQGIGRKIGIDEVYAINKFAIEDVMPDLTIMFDITPEEGLERINNCTERTADRLDLETLDFHKSAYFGYMQVAEMFKNRIVKINASLSIEEVYKQAYKIIKGQLCNKKTI